MTQEVREPVSSSAEIEAVDQFKAAFRRYPTGVAVISAATPSGPVGLTASSVASVSVKPRALSFSVMGSPSARSIVDAPSFVVNLLGPEHVGLARDFARVGGPRFTPDQGWSELPAGEPFLTSALAFMRCTPLHLVPVGDTTLVVASVLEVGLGPAGGRLIYHDREFIASPPE
ncbi:flavin reductase family protein [Micromonospora sp. NPDC023888]|uniref:flavin reductase family protein n=1 Tax=Micromonospora sp. NPDC023888 TaxID=3155607 RepID=UPI0033E217E8